MDFGRLASALLARADTLVPEWFPAGKRRGREYVVGNLAGDAGSSLSINLTNGKWADFAAGIEGGDLVSLYAAAHGLEQGAAYRELESRYPASVAVSAPARSATQPYQPVKPNGASGGFTGTHPQHGEPYALHAYRDATGEVLFYVARYHLDTGKTFCPWTYDGRCWQRKAWPAPRPLYGLELLHQYPQSTVLIVEGELKCDLARRVLNPARQAVVVTWCGGAAAYRHTDWSPLAGRRVIIWPDADDAGRAAAEGIATLIGGSDIRLIDTSDRAPGWDVADFIAEGATSAALQTFVREHCVPYKNPARPPQQLTAPAAPTSASAPAEVTSAAPVGAERPVFATQGQAWEHFNLAIGTGGRPWANIYNVQQILKLHPRTRGRFCWDEFSGRVLLDNVYWDADQYLTELTVMLQGELFMHRVNPSTVLEAIEGYAKLNRVHPIKQYLESLEPHDGTSRVSTFFTRALGATDSDYMRAAAVSFFCSCIARIYDPGCILRTMPVFEGEQDAGKSTTLAILGADWYLDNSRRIDSKEFEQDLQGYWIVELSELSSMLKSSTESVKSCLSRRDDVFRASYGRRAQSHKRQCVLVGTTNSTYWQADETGGTRFLPVACGAIDLTYTRERRDQLWTEAVALYRSGREWWQIPRAAAKLEQLARHVSDSWSEPVTQILSARQSVTLHELYELMSIKVIDRDHKSDIRCAKILAALGWTCKVEWMSFPPPGHSIRVYRPKETK